ncbi:class I SAM-dependent methyltransferase [Radiobacillus deserti]|uniref:Methyltransferase domain-containing protein n=1 Tax=Radiobacillus deserti TaxID=2594883 RepID=A0A516KHT9_9BACI|nr:class I SAM-dependent methyltransferase [Radiobacillus deserti]QDP40926.1 methyltransferase domain-containing protein [Radiobacillus deserti]
MVLKVIPFAHELLKQTVREGDIVIDATCGKGHDTLLLSQLVKEKGRVFAFDVQEDAIRQTNEQLKQYGVSNTTLILDSHEKINEYVPSDYLIGGAIFNLGYLPGSDKQTITQPESTVQAIQQIITRLKKHCLLVIVVYAGHPGGEEEKEAVLQFVQTLSQKEYAVLQYGFINQQNSPPFVLAIERIK